MSSQTPSVPPSPQPTPPKFDPGAAHQNKPRLRGVRGFPVQAKGPDGKDMTLLGLADAQQITDKSVVVMPAAQLILPHMDGAKSIDDIVTQVGRGLSRPIVEQLVAQLDDAGLLEGPPFESMLAKVHADFDSAPILPPAGSAEFADSLVMHRLGQGATEEQKKSEAPRFITEVFDQWISRALEKAENPAFTALPRAVVAPHLDYARGWVNYASIYGRLRVCDRPDRVVILGTNHFGRSSGVAGCDKGYETPLGVCEADTAVVKGLKDELGDKLFENRFDHEREHSIELHMMWIQHVFGKDSMGRFPTVFGALVHDPTVNNGESYDGLGIGIEAFVAALKRVLAGLPGRTLVVSSADLSHVGPAFGDKLPLAGEGAEATNERNRVFGHDQEMIKHLAERRPMDLVAAMSWQQNPTRWCSIGNLIATMMTVEPSEVEVLNYAAAMDQQGMAMVSSVAIAMR